MDKHPPKNTDEYIRKQPKEIQAILKKMRETIRKAAPKAEETIGYQMPTFKQGRNLVHFAAFKDHVSFFPGSSGVGYFMNELGKYKTSKGTIQFELDKPIPYGLITRITRFRVREEEARSAQRRRR